MRKLTLIALLSLFSVFSISCFADEVEDAIKQATELYKSGNAKQAVTQLEYAAKLIREQRGAALIKYLPAALSGWKAEEAEADTAGAAMFGGGTSVSRGYSRGDTNITITITTDSPMLQSIMMMLSNPMMFQGQGAKLKMVKGNQVIFNEDGAMAVINNAYLVQVEKGSDVKPAIDPDVLAYVEAIDFAGIANLK